MNLQRIKNFDYDNYICAIFADKGVWEDIATILEFNIEIATIKSKVSESTLGLIRLQWWREAIEEIFTENKKVKAHQVVLGLKELSNKHLNFNKDKFLKIINARDKDLSEYPFSNLDELLQYVEDTAFGINDIIFDVLGGSDELRSIVRDFSMAWGITAIIRAYGNNLSKGRKIIPDEVSLGELIGLADDKIKSARESLKLIKDENLKKYAPVLLKGRIAEFYLKQFKNSGFNYKKPKIKSLEGFGVLRISAYYYLNKF